jgi:hypothetical protein
MREKWPSEPLSRPFFLNSKKYEKAEKGKREQIVDNQESIGKPKKSVVDKAARVWLVIGVIVLVAIAVTVIALVAGSINRGIQRAESRARVEEKRQELHIERLRGLQAEGDAWDRLKKLARSARTEKERAFVQSEIAKLRVLEAEGERVYQTAKTELDRAKAELERNQ